MILCFAALLALAALPGQSQILNKNLIVNGDAAWIAPREARSLGGYFVGQTGVLNASDAVRFDGLCTDGGDGGENENSELVVIAAKP